MKKPLPLFAALILCAVLLCRAVVWACPQLPHIALNKSRIEVSAALGSSPANQTFVVSNDGGPTLNYSVSGTQGWILVPAPGTPQPQALGEGAQQTITVAFDTAALGAGTHNAEITITGNTINSPQKIDVTLTVVAPEYRSTPKMHGNWN